MTQAQPHTASDRVLTRLMRLHPKKIDLTLGRVERLLAALGNPQDRLPPVIHVAGTNGKGSTVATMRACFEAASYRVHVYTSPHLVRFHERIRLAGELIDEDALLAALDEASAPMAARRSRFSRSRPPGVSRLLADPRRHRAARNRARRTARRDERHPPSGCHRDYADFARSPGVSRRHDCGNRRRKSRYPEARRARHHRTAARRGRRRNRSPRRSDRRTALSLAPGMAL